MRTGIEPHMLIKKSLLVLSINTLECAREKLDIYRDHSNGEYHGGIEHVSLIGMIDKTRAILNDAITKQEKDDGRSEGSKV